MRRIEVPRLAFVMAVCFLGIASHEVVIAQVNAEAVDESLPSARKDFGRLIWTLMETIEREHIESPQRTDLVPAVARAMFASGRNGNNTSADSANPKNPPQPDARVQVLENQIRACQNGEKLNRLIDETEFPIATFDEFILNIGREFDKSLGDIQLIPSKVYEVDEQFRGNRYVGLGVSVGIYPKLGLPTFPSIVPGGPADHSGLEKHTIVHEIDGQSTEGLSMQQTLDLLRGQKGSDVTLRVSSPNSSEKRTVTITRSVIRIDSLKTRNFSSLNRDGLRYNDTEPIGWIRVTNITGSTLHELRAADARAKANEIRALVLDFRASDGTDLHQAMLVADGLLNSGTIWHQTQRSFHRIETADRECLFRGVPIVALVDQNTGPMSCAVAAALQDAGRAIVAGDTPEFDGVVSTAVRLADLPFYVGMPTTRLTRSNPDRSWPLIPDRPTGDLATSVELSVVKRIGEIDEAKNNSPAEVSKTRGTKLQLVVTKLDSAGSKERTNTPSSATPNLKFPQPKTQTRVPVPDELALRVARELIQSNGSDSRN
jgi:C-terminal peptidase prc